MFCNSVQKSLLLVVTTLVPEYESPELEPDELELLLLDEELESESELESLEPDEELPPSLTTVLLAIDS